MDITDELATLSQDLRALQAAYRDSGDRATVFRMYAAKCEQSAEVFRLLADGLDAGEYEIV